MTECPRCAICGNRPAWYRKGKQYKLCATCAFERIMRALRYAKSAWHEQRGKDEARVWRLGERHRQRRMWERRARRHWRRPITLYPTEPWLVLTEEQEYQLAKEEYEHNHGTCEVCNGEWGDGWSNCICDSREWPDDDWGLEER